ncbi:MAG: hypothetical protein A2086_13315 [Spirochaetes bacterium GWD1_27_9]|nr:MAG: hypothetical protein A2Z98_15220 [Spirochaetes bacterium GWB1_27_13]OHD27007.1 MAG: hypothetical protein A2Y34_07715 [Spirochaetes bacterium GWC1_27_15]OHD45676.1 MAG: hypothetical protein A2086_13315 [Spirochaetes bacterium GWD1_27_9]
MYDEKKETLRKRALEVLSNYDRNNNLGSKDIKQLIAELQTYQIELELQNEELNNSYDQIQEMTNKYLKLFNYSPVSYFILNENGLILEANFTSIKQFNFEEDILVKQLFSSFVATESFSDFFVHLNKTLETKQKETCELKLKTKDGIFFYGNLVSILLEENQNNQPKILTAVIDITERKINEEKIKDSMEEKEVLLKEIYHRVKNNLQVVSSLLSLQAEKIENQEIVEAFKESQNRIRSISLVHEKLYQSENLSKIDFDGYIRDLIYNLIYSFNVDTNIKFNLNISNVFLNIDIAIPCGLIINEIISNSFKYAFPNGKKGEINLSLSQIENKIELSISDNGIGLPINIDIEKPKTLGLTLIKLLTYQLRGKMEIKNQDGVYYKIEFSEIRKHM